MTFQRIRYASVVLTAFLAACGGGGGGGSSGSASTPDNTTPVVTNLTLTGTAAQGDAIANKSVEAKCATGTGTATTSGTGEFTITISGGVLPCVLKVDTVPYGTLRSLATGATTDRSARANITTVTDLVVAQVSGQTAADYYASFPTNSAKLSSTNVAAAVTAVKSFLKSSSGVDFSTIDPLTVQFTAPVSGSTNSDPYDQKLLALGTAIRASASVNTNNTSTDTQVQTAYTDLSKYVADSSAINSATNGGSSSGSGSSGSNGSSSGSGSSTDGSSNSGSGSGSSGNGSSGNGSSGSTTTTGIDAITAWSKGLLPTNLMFKQASAHCSYLRTGDYREIWFQKTYGTTSVRSVSFDGAVESFFLKASSSQTTSDTTLQGLQLAAVTSEPCRYKSTDGADEYFVSKSGVYVVRRVDSTSNVVSVGIGFPEQQLAVSELTGDWNMLRYNLNYTGTSLPVGAQVWNVDSQGAFKPTKGCASFAAGDCSDLSSTSVTLAASDSGGFYNKALGASNANKGDIFAYKSGTGDIMMIALTAPIGGANSWFMIGTQAKTLSLPAIANKVSYWNVYLDGAFGSSMAVDSTTSEVLTISTTAQTYTQRNTVASGTYETTATINTPLNGYGTQVGTAQQRPYYALPLQGMGLVSLYLPTATSTMSTATKDWYLFAVVK